MMYFITKFPSLFNSTSNEVFTGFDDETADFLLSYDNLYNSIMVSRALMNYYNNDIDNFYKLYHTSYAKELVFYVRYVIIELAWGGFVKE
jgi:hypothetical protein